MDNCAPNIVKEDNYTCFSKQELQEIALAFNIYIQTNNICNSDTCVPKRLIPIENMTKKELWKKINDALGLICGDEVCWINQKFIKVIKDDNLRDKILDFTFKPRAPGTDQWLSTSDINKVMQQFQEFDHSFKFLGALPCDFYLHTNVEYHKIQRYKKIGIVFNLDRHNQPGSHWVAFLIDNVSKTMEYFDSAGDKPNKCIKSFIELLKKTLLSKYTYKINKKVHQKQNSECGVYAMYFIIQRLLGHTFDEVTSNIVRDNSMSKFRKYIFRS